jgi:hypothetical protein
MDGRRFRWCVYGGLLVSAVGCHRNNTYPELPKPGQTVGAIPPPGGGLFGSKPPALPNGPMPNSPGLAPNGMPIEVVERPKSKPGQGFKPDTLVTFGDTWAQSAFFDPPPPNRDELIDRARHAYQKALEKDPKNKGAMLGMARLYARMGDHDRADEMYKKYVDANPKDADARHEVALAHGQWKDWAGAVTWCEAALKLDPENRKYRKTLGFSQAMAGNWQGGLESLCEVMSEAQARHNLAGLLEHLGQPALARQQLQLAIQSDPNYAPAREFMAELDQPAPPAAGVPATAPNPVLQAGYNPQP